MDIGPPVREIVVNPATLPIPTVLPSPLPRPAEPLVPA
jgi:hypothetical protein